MKTKELIRQLQEADPTGEVEVCVGNVDIHFVQNLPAYYDGALQVLKRDENCEYFNIIGGKYVRSGRKVVIEPLSISDVIGERDIEIDYSELPTDRQELAKKAHEDLKLFHRKLENSLELKHFQQWAKKEAEKLTEDLEDIKAIATRFFEDNNMSPNDLLPDGKVLPCKSYVETREIQWGQKFKVILNDGFLEIIKSDDPQLVVS